DLVALSGAHTIGQAR
nr:RecName: Full=Peroxidase 2 [Cycas revoluta]